jgi:hypothetical protein
MSRRAAARSRGGAELGTGLARVGWLEDFALAAGTRVVGRGVARGGAAGTIGQRFRAVHFVEVGFVDAGGAASRVPPFMAHGAGDRRAGTGGGERRTGRRRRRRALPGAFQCVWGDAHPG